MKKTAYFLAIAVIALLLLTAAGCDTSNVGSADGINIVCSVFPQYDFCRVIVGDRANVTLLQKNGADMHSYEPTTGDIIKVADCDILVYVGGGSDGWVEGVLRSARNEDIVTCSLFDYASLLHEENESRHDHTHDHEHEGEEYDEHVWMSPKNAVRIVEGLLEVICGTDPENEEYYRKNAEDYITRLTELDLELSEACKGKTVIVADRFPFLYLTHEYGIEYCAAFPGCSSETEASFETMTYLINSVKDRGVKCIYKADGSDGSIAASVAELTDTRVLTLYSCQSVTQKQLDEGVSYLSLMRLNLEALKEE